jgi:hypothetical protein
LGAFHEKLLRGNVRDGILAAGFPGEGDTLWCSRENAEDDTIGAFRDVDSLLAFVALAANIEHLDA